jgi:hypothetical protein
VLSVLENLALRQQLLALHAKRPRRRLGTLAQAVLDCFTKVLVRMERASHFGYTENGCRVASGRLPVVGPGFQEPDEREDEDG